MNCAAENEHCLKDENNEASVKKQKPPNAIQTCCLRPPSRRIKAVCTGSGQGGLGEEIAADGQGSRRAHGAVTPAFGVTHLESTVFF